MDQRKVQVRSVTFPNRKGCPYYEISSTSNHNLQAPLLYLCKMLAKDPDLYFTQPLALPPPTTAVDPERMHSGPNFPCSLCFNNFDSRQALERHILSGHCDDDEDL